MANVAFLILALLTVTGAIITVSVRNAVHASLGLVGTLLSVAGLYATMNASFLGAVQVIVYAGAIMVLFLFVIMLLDANRPISGRDPQPYITGGPAGEHAGHRAGRDAAPAGHDRDVVADLLHLGEQMGGQEHRGPPVVAEAAKELPDIADAGRVEPVARFVQDEQARLLQQGGGDTKPLLHPERVTLEALVRPVGQVDDL